MGGTAATVLVSLLPFADPGPLPAAEAGPVAIVVGVAVLSVVSAIGILWGVRLVSPGRAGLLMMMEVVTGLASAAAFAGEPFGAVQVTGSMLIATAALVEVIPAGGRRSARSGS